MTNNEKLEFGTIIYAKRYQTNQEMLRIEKGHRKGPYIVIGTKENKYICLEGTSPTKVKQLLYFTLPHIGKYSLTKDTYFNLWKPYLKSKNDIISVLDKLDEKDSVLLKKRFSMLDTNKIYSNSFDIPPIGPNDIIQVKTDILLLLSQNEKGYNCLHLSKSRQNGYFKQITINGMIFYFIPVITIIKEFDSDVKRINCIDDRQFQAIDLLLKNYQEYERQKETITIGSLVKKEDNLYLIYGDFETDWLALQIDCTNTYFPSILINQKKYYIHFNNTINIPKKEEVEVITLATESEMQEMRKKRKKFLYMNKPPTTKAPKKSKTFYTSGDILSPYSDLTQEFVVITYQNKNVFLVNKDGLITKRYQLTIDDENRFKNDFIRVGKLDKDKLKIILIDIKDIIAQRINESQVKKLLLELEEKTIKNNSLK